MSRQNWKEGQEIPYQDLNAIPKGSERTILDKVIWPLIGKQEGFYGDAFKVTFDDATNVTLEIGCGIQQDTSQSAPEPETRILYNPDDTTLYTIETPDATNDRIDIVQVKAALADGSSVSREVKAIDDSVSTESVVLRKTWEADIQIKAGTPAGSPSAPSPDSGYIKVAELYVTASSGIADQDAITDTRTKMIAGKTHQEKITSDVTWEAPTGVKRIKASYIDIESQAGKIAAGNQSSAFIDGGGNVWTCGSNSQGQLGDGTTTDRTTFTRALVPVPVKMISCLSNHMLALDIYGTIWAWGANSDGQLGDNTTSSRSTPAPMAWGRRWKFIAAGDDFSLAIDASGDLYGWGKNQSYTLGHDSSFADVLLPTLVPGGHKWKWVTAGRINCSGVTEDGDLYTWGEENSGNLGDGSGTDNINPTQITSPSKTWSKVWMGPGETAHAITEDGELWGWGEGSAGQIGDGATTDRTTPVQVASGTTWTWIGRGDSQTYGLDDAGNAYGWGTDVGGNLGVGSPGSVVSSPSALNGGHTTKVISAGEGYGFLATTDGDIYAWGDASGGHSASLGVGVLGDGADSGTVTSPAQPPFEPKTHFEHSRIVFSRFVDVTPGNSYSIQYKDHKVKLGSTVLGYHGGGGELYLEYGGY